MFDNKGGHVKNISPFSQATHTLRFGNESFNLNKRYFSNIEFIKEACTRRPSQTIPAIERLFHKYEINILHCLVIKFTRARLEKEGNIESKIWKLENIFKRNC